ncbi:kinase-like domain-containing protein [Pisolithus marmoratus]|nr:kinase-like domain-containing protein [Pisolithus marmoratus]
MDSPLQVLSRHAARYSVNLDGQVIRDANFYPLCGGCADVYRGTLRSTDAEVAIKIIRADLANDITVIKRTLREVHLWSKLQDENILPLFGITTDFDCTVSIVSPWVKNGNALTYVQDENVDPRPLLVGIARGLRYLHTHDPPIFHGDLKGLNVLISTEGHALLSDFGLSTLVTSSFSITISRPSGGSIRWMSPEVIDSSTNASARGDVWAFGMTALELFTRDIPFNAISLLPAVMLRILEGLPDRPSSNSTCFRMTEDWWQLCLSCWQSDPSARPQISEILTRIQTWQENPRTQGTSSSSTEEFKNSTLDTHLTPSDSSIVLSTKESESVCTTSIPSSEVHFSETMSSDDYPASHRLKDADTSGSFSLFLASITDDPSTPVDSSKTTYNQNDFPSWKEAGTTQLAALDSRNVLLHRSPWMVSTSPVDKNLASVLPTKDAGLTEPVTLG